MALCHPLKFDRHMGSMKENRERERGRKKGRDPNKKLQKK
jgi:hypothetical protein